MSSLGKKRDLFELSVLAILAAGILVRMLALLSPRELWMDECDISLRILRLTPSQILRPINAPIGFVLAQKITSSITIFGEKIFRFVPFLYSLAAQFAMYAVCRKVLSRWATILTMAAFALSPILEYYSGEAKQYSSDVFFSILLLLFALQPRDESRKGIRTAMLLAGIAVISSHPSIFIIGSVALYQLLERPVRCVLPLAFAGCAAALFGLLYWISYRHEIAIPFMQNYWRPGFPPAGVFEPIGWAFLKFRAILALTIPVCPDWLLVAIFAAGSVYWIRRDWRLYLLFTAPLPANIASAALHAYPFSGNRISLYLVPLFMMVLAGAVELLVELLSNRRRAMACIGTAAVIFLSAASIKNMRHTDPRISYYTKEGAKYLRDNGSAGDVLYADMWFLRPYDFYGRYIGFKKVPYYEIDPGRRIVTYKFHPMSPALLIGKKVWVYQAKKNPAAWRREIDFVRCMRNTNSAIQRAYFREFSLVLYDLTSLSVESRIRLEGCLLQIVSDDAPKKGKKT